MMKALAAAKINLYLDVNGKRPDGYHEIETFFQPVSLWDELTFETAASGVRITGNDASIPWNEDNLCHRAARLIFERSGFGGGVTIVVRKGIPAGAGLGGGSSDAAATLVATNALFDFGLSRTELLDLGSSLGSDVPFFILGVPAIGRGRGEILEEVRGLRDGWILVVKPDITISTKWAYQNLTLLLTRDKAGAKLEKLREGLQRFPDIRLDTHNSFEAGVIERFPSVAGLLATLRAEGPIMCSLSGSGSACFAIFADEGTARRLGARLGGEGLFTKVVRPIDRAIRLE
jgi:4-diphosphocytidyl-2-C-methyl-D-erythritol kinase